MSDTCDLWGCGRPAKVPGFVRLASDSSQKAVHVCDYHAMMIRDASARPGGPVPEREGADGR